MNTRQQVLMAAVVAGVLAGAGIKPAAADTVPTTKAERHTAGSIDKHKCGGNGCNGHCHSISAKRR